MSNGVKIGLLGVIAVLLGIIAYKLISSGDSQPMSKEIVQANGQTAATGSAAENGVTPGTFYPVQNGQMQTPNGAMPMGEAQKIGQNGQPLPPAKPGTPQGGNTQSGVASANRAKTTMKFEKIEHDFGTMKDGDRVEYSFKFTNTGKEPLIIEDAKGSCGCTVPVWPKDPIAPGKSDEIRVSFNSAGKQGAQSKVVTLTANTEPLQSKLTIKANVLAKDGSAVAQPVPTH